MRLNDKLLLVLVPALALGAGACGKDDEAGPTKVVSEQEPASKPGPKGAGGEPGEGKSETETDDDPRSGEAAHVIPFADRTSMGYLLLLPPGSKQPKPPSREQLQTLVRQAFPGRRRDAEIDLLLQMIATPPHTTDLGFNGELELPDEPEAPEVSDKDGASGADEDGKPQQLSEAELEELVAKRERQRIFDLIGLHIELLPLGVGDAATVPSSALDDPILTRGLSEEQRKTLPGRSWALLLRADYRNRKGVRGLRLHQTLVRIAAEHYDALIHDPDTLETMNLETFTERRLRAEAGNVADQIAIVPFVDGHEDELLRLSTRGMRRFGAVDIELDGLPRDERVLQQASDLIAGLALALAKEAEVDVSGFAVEVPELVEVDGDLIRQSYSARGYEPPLCEDCPGSVAVHLVERPPEEHDPEDHVVARIVAPREQSDASDYDHPQWVLSALARLFGDAGGATPGR